MCLRKLCLFTLAATLAGSTTVGMLNVQIKEYEVPTPKSRPYGMAVNSKNVVHFVEFGANKGNGMLRKKSELGQRTIACYSRGG